MAELEVFQVITDVIVNAALIGLFVGGVLTALR